MIENHLEDVELYSSESISAVKASSESVRLTLAEEKTEVVLITKRCRGRLIPTIKDWFTHFLTEQIGYCQYLCRSKFDTSPNYDGVPENNVLSHCLR